MNLLWYYHLCRIFDKFYKFIDCLRRLIATAENIHLMLLHQIQQVMRTTLEIDDDVLAAGKSLANQLTPLIIIFAANGWPST